MKNLFMLLDKLKGYKTYLCAGGLILTAILLKFEVLDVNTASALGFFFAGGMGITLRSGIKNEINKTQEGNDGK